MGGIRLLDKKLEEMGNFYAFFVSALTHKEGQTRPRSVRVRMVVDSTMTSHFLLAKTTSSEAHNFDIIRTGAFTLLIQRTSIVSKCSSHNTFT